MLSSNVWLVASFLFQLACGSPMPAGGLYPSRISTSGIGPTSTVITAAVEELPTSWVFVVTDSIPYTTSTSTITTSSSITTVTETLYPGYYYSGLNQQNTKESTSFIIDVIPNNETYRAYTVCWYPISGNYCRLPRILFYITIAAAILLRHRLPWLYLGALAASLTYSGSAAIHASLLIWRGPARGEVDLYPLLGILSVSCIVLVPLFNWSSTIRNAGKPGANFGQPNSSAKVDNEEIDAASRLVLICWAFLVTVGFLSAFVGLVGPKWSITVRTGAESIACAPEFGVLNVTAGQPPVTSNATGYVDWDYFIITQEFIAANNCQNPCSKPSGGTAIFRNEGDLSPLRERHLYQLGGTNTQTTLEKFEILYANKWAYVNIYIIIQGIWIVAFGRNTPSQIRIKLYERLSKWLNLGRSRGYLLRISRWAAQAIALGFYSWSVIVLIITIPVLVLNVTIIEIYISDFPQPESAQHIGAWSPYSSTAFVLIAAFIGKIYQPGFKWNDLVPRFGGLNIRNRQGILNKRFVDEWSDFVDFVKDPEQCVAQSHYSSANVGMSTLNAAPSMQQTQTHPQFPGPPQGQNQTKPTPTPSANSSQSGLPSIPPAALNVPP